MKKYDVAIIGAGPAGLFAALTILKNTVDTNILLVDKGKKVLDRMCCEDCQVCPSYNCCDMLCGIGGSGLFSDGKLVLDLHSGGKLDTIAELNDKKRCELENTILTILREHDGLSESGPDASDECKTYWEECSNKAGLNIKHYDVLHMGTKNLQHITSSLADEICSNPRMCLKTECNIEKIVKDSKGNTLLISQNGETEMAEYIVFAIGKTGSEWLKKTLSAYSVQFYKGNTYIGVRLEVPHESIKSILSYSFDPKIWAFYNGRKAKTHCFCRHGEIVCTNYMGYPVVGGHTRFTQKNHIPDSLQSSNGNFNILVSTDRHQKDILELLESTRQLNPSGIIGQKLQDYLKPANNTMAIPSTSKRIVYGNIRHLLDKLDLTGTIIADFIIRLSKIFPDILNESSMVYAPAIEWYMDSVKVDRNMETAQEKWFAVGDGAGLSQGIVHSAATSIIAAEEVCRRINSQT